MPFPLRSRSRGPPVTHRPSGGRSIPARRHRPARPRDVAREVGPGARGSVTCGGGPCGRARPPHGACVAGPRPGNAAAVTCGLGGAMGVPVPLVPARPAPLPLVSARPGPLPASAGAGAALGLCAAVAADSHFRHSFSLLISSVSGSPFPLGPAPSGAATAEIPWVAPRLESPAPPLRCDPRTGDSRPLQH